MPGHTAKEAAFTGPALADYNRTETALARGLQYGPAGRQFVGDNAELNPIGAEAVTLKVNRDVYAFML
jgi:hypothetical protein